MKHYAYTDEYVSRDRAGNVTRRTTLYSVKRNIIKQIGTAEYTYMDAFQAVLDLAERHKLMPKAAFERHSSGGYKYHAWSLKEAGIANVQHV